jgi:hypothetical protein
MFPNQRFLVSGGPFQGGQVILRPDVAERHADIPQQPAPLHPQNRAPRKPPLEIRRADLQQGVKLIAA